jgi:hypothetical protein
MMAYPIARDFAASRAEKIYSGTGEITQEMAVRSLHGDASIHRLHDIPASSDAGI